MTQGEDPVAVAAVHTLAQPGAQVEHRRWVQQVAAQRDLSVTERGQTSFGQRRTLMQAADRGPAFDALVGRIRARWPWLEDIDDRDGGESSTLFAGTWCGFRNPSGRWSVIEDGDPHATRRLHSDPTWILDVLAAGRPSSQLRGDVYAFEVQLSSLRDVTELPPGSRRRGGGLHGYARVDDQGRLCDVAWAPSVFRRPRPSAAPVVFFVQRLKLSEFEPQTLPPVPAVRAERGPLPWIRTARGLYRRRRAYQQRNT